MFRKEHAHIYMCIGQKTSATDEPDVFRKTRVLATTLNGTY